MRISKFCYIIYITLVAHVVLGSEESVRWEESIQFYNEGVEYMKSGKIESAKQSFLAAVSIHNAFPEAHQNLANTFEIESNYEMAVTHHRLSMLYARNNHFIIAAVLNVVTSELKRNIVRKKHELTELLSLLVDAASLTALEPQSNVYFMAGLVYELMGEPNNALQMFKETLYIKPNHTLALLNMGNFYFRKNKFDIAMLFYQQSLQSIDDKGQQSDNLKYVLNNLGQCYRETSQLRLSLFAFTRAHNIALSTETINGWTIGNVFAIKGLLCDWKNSELVEHDLKTSIIKFALNSIGVKSTEDSYIDPYGVSLMTFSTLSVDKAICAKACKIQPFFSHVNKNISKSLSHRSGAPQIRIGYLSFDWRDHPMGRLTLFLVTNHNLSRIDSTSVSYGPDDSSSIRKDVQRLSTTFLDVYLMKNDFEVASLLQSKEFDILIDLTSHTYSGRIDILALKPAPIVINYLGFPGTTGCTAFDYSMVDRHVVPPEYHSQAFSENLIYLPYLYQANSMPIDVPLCHNLLDCRQQRGNFSTLIGKGDSEVRWLCSFNANKKMERISFLTWMNAMRRIPFSILLLQDTNSETKENILQQAKFHGVIPSRIIFIPTLQWKDHLFRASACDLVLDTFIYGAHTTSSDMLWMWVPVLSLSSWGSDRMPSRVAASITQSLSAFQKEVVNNEDDPSDILVQYSVKAYEDTAVRLMRNSKVLSTLHEKIGSLTLRSPTFDSQLMERSVEQAYQLAMELRVLRENVNFLSALNRMNGRGSIVMIPTMTNDPARSWRFNVCNQVLQSESAQSETNQNSILRRCKCSFIQYIPSEVEQKKYFGRKSDNISQANNSDLTIKFNFMDSLRQIVKDRSIEKLDSLQWWFRSPENIEFVQNAPLFDIAVLVEDVVLWQQDLMADCHLEGQIFDFIAPFFLDFILVSQIYDSSTNNSTAPEEFNYSIVWKYSTMKSFSLAILFDVLKASRFSSLDGRSVFFSQLKGLIFNNVPDDRNTVHVLVQFMQNQLSLMLNSHGVCQHNSKDSQKSIYLFLSAFFLSNNIRGLLNAGLVLMDMGYLDIGFFLASQAQFLDHTLNFKDRNSHLLKISNEIHGNCSTASLHIAIYCNEYGQSWWPEWGPSSLHEQGMGGSEEAVYYTSIELAKLGHSVYIFADLSDADVGYVVEYNVSREYDGTYVKGKVTWLHHHNFDVDDEFDVFIAWRYVLSLSLSKSSQLSFLWLHDLIPASTFPKSYFKLFSGIFVQSAFHQSHVNDSFNSMSTFYLDKDIFSVSKKLIDARNQSRSKNGITITIVPNGISELFALDGSNVKHNFIYGSAPNRGLQNVLESWGYIKSRIPAAILHVYYGFTDAFQQNMKKSMGEQDFNSWYAVMKGLLLQDGIEYHGSVNHSELTNAYRNAGFFLYPTHFQETGCISALRAMSCGCIPITSRLVESVLYDLTIRFDMGPSTPLTLSIVKNRTAHREWLVNKWAVSVVDAYHTDETVLLAKRNEMKRIIREDFAWSNTALRMLDAF